MAGFIAILKDATSRQDWAYLVSHLLIIIPLILVMEIAGDDPVDRSFSIYDATISYEYKGDSTIPIWLVPLIPFLSLLISFLIFEVWAFKRQLVTAAEALASGIFWVIEFISLGIVTALLTEVFKILVGRYRPDWLDRCNPGGAGDDITVIWGLPPSDNPSCNATVSDSKLADGHKSFPSGHSSSAFALGMFVAAYVLYIQFWWPPRRYFQKNIAGRGGRTEGRSPLKRLGAEFGEILVLGWALFQISWAWGVAISRVRDNKHHPSDIVGGALLGITICMVYLGRAIPRHCSVLDAPKIQRGGSLLPNTGFQSCADDQEIGVAATEETTSNA